MLTPVIQLCVRACLCMSVYNPRLFNWDTSYDLSGIARILSEDSQWPLY